MKIKPNHFTLLFICVFLLNSNTINAQHKNDFEAGLFNIGFGSIIGGIGAILNKKTNEKTGKVFLKGLYQGALGGYLLFESKSIVGKFSKTGNYNYVWPSKIVNAAGVSIIENAAANRDFWEQWHINISFNRIAFYTAGKFKVSYRIMPFALGNTIYGFTQGKLDINESMKVGSLVFTTYKIKSSINYDGFVLSNSIVIVNNEFDIIGHEIIHVYQYESFSGLNSFLNKPIYNLNVTKNWSKIYHKIFYTDFNYLSFRFFHDLYKNYDSNFFEKEAYYYTKN